VPEGFHVEVAAGPELSSYPMLITLDNRGRLFIAESSGKDISGKEMVEAPECVILMLEDTNDDGFFDTRTVYADKLSLPMGVLCHQGNVYVASPPDFFRFKDTNDDGVADEREILLTGWNVFNTASLHGPFLGPDGWLYLTHGRHGYKITTKEGEVLEGLASRIWRCRPDGTQLERVAGGGFDNPVELVWTNGGDMFGTMTYFTDPKNGQRDALLHFVEGGVYPKFHESVSEFVRTGNLMPVMTKFARIAPSGLALYRSEAWGPEFEGNLFSAQFNPHRVQRHVVHRESGTYWTEDSDFMTSTNSDFHPTDVEEDADGSLLVSDTGAWYVDACPISRVAKPEIRGAIYRIRKTNAERFEVGRVKFEGKRAKDVVEYLGDPRPRVREQALEALVTRGGDAVKPLGKALQDGASVEQRTGAVWALCRIATDDARQALRRALLDESYEVRMAAAHALAMNRDKQAAEPLAALLDDPDPGVRREAALALGRIGAKEAAPALLAACSTAADRFEEHGLIYGAIQLGADQSAAEALDSEAAAVRNAALIVLDQLQSPLLTKEDLVPFLAADDEALRETGLWVASRHPEWSDVVLSFLEEQLRADSFDAAKAEPLKEILLAYAGDKAVQDLIAGMLHDEEAATTRRLFLFDVLDKSALSELPVSWVDAIGATLASSDEQLRWRAANIIRSRTLTQFDETLEAIANDPDQPIALRVNALGTVLQRKPQVAATQFETLVSCLSADTEPAVRLAAGKNLANAELNAAQLGLLATDYLPKSDALTYSALLDAFRKSDDAAVGLALIKSLDHAPINPNQIPGGVNDLLAGYPEPVQHAAGPLRAQAEAEEKARIERLLALEPLLGTGDVGRGRSVFFGEKVACSTCHAVGEEGGDLGPDLTTIGAIRSGHDLLEALLFPSASFVPPYESYTVATEWETFSGVVGRETQDAITLKTAADDEVRIPRNEIRSMTPSPISVMPEGLDAGITQEELLDLMAFLQSLNNEVWLLPERRGASDH
jgi:putative membrane-bound dehydrogenase-like protein